MRSHLTSFATISAAATAIALTALPWVDLTPLNLDLSWNGLGMSGATGAQAIEIAPDGRGWLVIAACVIALLAALLAMMPAPSARPLARVANAIAAVAALLGALVPVIVMIWPQWYYGDLVDGIGLSGDMAADVIPPSAPILIALTLVMLLTAALCAYASRPGDEKDAPVRTK